MTNKSLAIRTGLILSCLLVSACSHQGPTIAHIHVGHAVTGAHDTPGKVGYFTVAEESARRALAAAELAISPSISIEEIKTNVKLVDEITNHRGDYPLTKAVRESADHIEFAALSDDASQNLVDGYQRFRATTAGILHRGDLIAAFASQVNDASDLEEAQFVASEVHGLARANVVGIDEDGDGTIGSTPTELGVQQVSNALQALINNEEPPYTTVDRWYLFNLIRLPNGDWIFKRSGGGASRGY